MVRRRERQYRDWDTSDKAGQGISAWTKMANAIISTMQQQFHEWMQDSLLDNVMWAVDRSDREIAEEFKSRGMAEHMSDARAQTISIDASEFDQSQKHVGNVAISNLAKAAGAPPITIVLYTFNGIELISAKVVIKQQWCNNVIGKEQEDRRSYTEGKRKLEGSLS